MPFDIRPVVGAQPPGSSVLKSSPPFRNKSALPSTASEVSYVMSIELLTLIAESNPISETNVVLPEEYTTRPVAPDDTVILGMLHFKAYGPEIVRLRQRFYRRDSEIKGNPILYCSSHKLRSHSCQEVRCSGHSVGCGHYGPGRIDRLRTGE